MSENDLKPLAEETDVETLRAAIAEYQWLAKTLFKSLGADAMEDMTSATTAPKLRDTTNTQPRHTNNERN